MKYWILKKIEKKNGTNHQKNELLLKKFELFFKITGDNRMLIELDDDFGFGHLLTSRLKKIEFIENEMIVETKNSIYTFEKI